MLRAEVEADPDRPRQAQLLYEMGRVIEQQLGNDALAVKEYLTSYNLDPAFRPPLFALVRVFERRRSFKNLARLYEAEAKSATSAGDRASAIVDRAVLLEDHLQQPSEAKPLYEEALDTDPGSAAAALMLERSARAAADREGTLRALERRAKLVTDPTLAALLRVEIAWERAYDGDLDGAFAEMREAAALPAGRWRSLDQMERLARRHDRSVEVIEAIEGRAVLAAATAAGEDQGQKSGAFSVQRFADEARARAEAAALWYESAQLRLSLHGDAEGTVQALEQAIALRPDDVLLHQERMLACELAGDLEGSAGEARYLIDRGVSGRFASALHFRLAELAQARGDAEAAAAALAAALEADPGSAAAGALLDDLLLDGRADEARVARLEARAEQDAEGRVDALWRAAQISSERLGDFARAKGLYERAAAAAEEPDRKTAVLRELYGAALRHGDGETARDTARSLVALPIDGEERAAILRDLYELLRTAVPDPGAAREVLGDSLADEAAVSWAADAARLEAAYTKDDALLAAAHRALADRATEEETQAAHLCAAARALARSGGEEAAIGALRAALERSPGHRYAVALLEEMLRARGEAEEVVALLREAAAAQAGARAAEMNLLLAGAAAEAGGDTALARQTYEEAADRDPTSVAPVLSLRRLAEQTGDADLVRDALEKLSELEVTEGEPARATFELAEHYDLVASKPELAESPLRAALSSPSVGAPAAVSLLALPGEHVDGAARVAAARRLLSDARDRAVAPLLRELAGEALSSGADPVEAEQSLDALLERRPDDRWALLCRTRLFGLDSSRDRARADAWLSLARVTDAPEAAADLMLHGLRAQMVAGAGDADDDAFLLAQELAATAPDSLAAGVALDETLTGGDDPESRVEALGARLSHSGSESGAALTAVVGRALTACGRSEQALSTLRRVVQEDPADLASWEALRVAAREERAWADVVAACDALAKGVDGELRAQLLEEAAAVLMDDLGRDDEARERLTRVLAIDGARPIAFGRLHDLLAEREDTRGLIDLVTKRIELVDDSDELVRLFYEQARLLRSEGDRQGALGALENVLMLEGDHVGALALQVEIHVSLEQWADAVETLRALAGADVPAAQKRLAHLGAADFLEKHLSDPAGAIAELRRIDEIGLADAGLFGRIADVAERAGLTEEAAAALGDAARASGGAGRAAFERRAAALHREQGHDAKAIAAYRRALEAVPDDLETGEALAELLTDSDERRAMAAGFEEAVRAKLEADPADEDALRKLRKAAIWRGDRDLEYLALGALSAMGLALPEEEDAFAERHETGPSAPSGVLSEASLARLRAAGADDPVARIAIAAQESVFEMDRLEPATYGVGRGELLSPKAESTMRDEVFALAALFGVESGDLYRGGRDAAQIAAVPGKKGRVTWILGDGIRAPLGAGQRFVIGQLAMSVREGTLPYVHRPPKDAAAVVMAAAAAAEVPLERAAGRTDIGEIARTLEKKMGRRARRAVAEAAQLAADGDPKAWARGAMRTALRAGLLSSGDLRVSLGAVLGAPASAAALADSADARDLVLYWLSGDHLALRRELGLAR